MTHYLMHWSPNPEIGLVILPVGVYYNRSIQEAKKGDVVIFKEDNTEYVILDICYIDLKSRVAGMLCRYIYNHDLNRVMERWVANAIIEGNGRRSVSRSKALVIRYGKGNTNKIQQSSTDS